MDWGADMRLRLPPKQAFPHSVDYKALTGDEDDWGKPEYTEPLTIDHARIDEGYDFKRGGVNATDDMPNALIVMFKKYNPNMPVFVNQGVITFHNKEFVITSNIPLYHDSDEIIGYELEVK